MAENNSQTAERVNLVYQSSVNGVNEDVELPFRTLVLSDLSCDEASSVLEGQEAIEISSADLTSLFLNIKPRLLFKLENKLGSQEAGDLLVDYCINKLDDFKPQEIAKNVPVIRDLLSFIEALNNIVNNELESSLENKNVVDALKSSGISIDEIKSQPESMAWLISDVEARITEQLNLILHHDDFQKMESAWRSLDFLLARTDFTENCTLSVLNVNKQALIEDFEDAPEVFKSTFYQIVYSAEFGQFGGKPYGVIIGDYDFSPATPDIKLLQQIAIVCATAHAPFITSASATFFHIDDYSSFSKLRDIASIFHQPAFEKWLAFRNTADARYIALCLPRFLLRSAYEESIGGLVYREKIKRNQNDVLWGNAAFAFASLLNKSFAKYRWCLNVTGKAHGVVEGLNIPLSNNMQSALIPTQVLINDRRESELVAQGFMPLSVHKGTDTAAFYSAYSSYDFSTRAENENEVDLSERLSAQIPYLFIVSRISHYIKIMQREHIGAWKNRRDIDQELNKWLRQYVSDMDNPAAGVRGRRPLRRAEIKVREVEGKGDWFVTRIQITPHIKHMGKLFTLSENSRLEKN